MRAALLRARLAPRGWTLLLAAAHRGISAIVRALLVPDMPLLQEADKVATEFDAHLSQKAVAWPSAI